MNLLLLVCGFIVALGTLGYLYQLVSECGFGHHDWSDGKWNYKTDDSCLQQMRCQRCFIAKQYREEHVHGDWKYLEQGSCRQQLSCERCKSPLYYRIEHELGDWEYSEAKSCKQVRECARCHEFSEERLLHTEWSDWEYLEADTCKQMRKCTRCGEASQERIQHAERETISLESVGTEYYNLIPKRERGDHMVSTSRCTRCGGETTESYFSEWND
jgi:hypothetical protein